MLPSTVISAYRYRSFRLDPGLRVTTQEQAVVFVRQLGFIFFWPIHDTPFPSLWAAVAGDRPVADEHDDPGHVTWGWKDAALGGQAWYYAKVLRKRATMISFEMAPYFYALSENYGAPEEDYLTQYEQGRLTLEAKTGYEALLDRGPLDTIELRRAARMSSMSSEGRFNKALVDLQADFKILPVGVSDAGAWHYAFVYDLVSRRYPELPDLAHPITEDRARQVLAEQYFRAMGGAPLCEVRKLFGWRPAEAERTITALQQAGLVQCNVPVEVQRDTWVVLSSLLG